MKTQEDEDEVDPFARAMACRAEYHFIAQAYDSALQDAHKAEHGTIEAIEHLQRANEMGPAMMDALRRYQMVVASLVERIRQT